MPPLAIATSTHLPHEGPIVLRNTGESHMDTGVTTPFGVVGGGFVHAPLNTPDGQLGTLTAVAAPGSTPATVSPPGPRHIITPVGTEKISVPGGYAFRNTQQSALAVDGAATGATVRVTGGAFAHAILNPDETLGAITAVAAPGNTPAVVAVAAGARRVISPLGPTVASIAVLVDRP